MILKDISNTNSFNSYFKTICFNIAFLCVVRAMFWILLHFQSTAEEE